jgi:hypothetical protein
MARLSEAFRSLVSLCDYFRGAEARDCYGELPRILIPRTWVNKVATVRPTIWRSLPLLRFRPWRQPYRSFPGLVINLVGTDVLTAPAAAVDGPRTALDFDVLDMTVVDQEERPYGELLLAFFYHRVVIAHARRLGSVVLRIFH